MSETENQETNGTANGDVPEIELIIKDEFDFTVTVEMLKEDLIVDCKKLRDTDSSKAMVQCEFSSIVPNESLPQDENCKNTSNKQKSAEAPLTRICSCQMNDVDIVSKACEGMFDDMTDELKATQLEERVSQKKNKRIDRRRSKCDGNAMQSAIAAVLEDDMSIGEAAKKYNLVKSTIWSRVSKHPNYLPRRKSNKELEEVIRSKFCEGLSLSEISRTLKVPKSTVFNHRQRLTECGLIPAMVEYGRPLGSKNFIKQRLTQAYRGHKVNGMSVRFAAEFYSVPVTTLWRFIRKEEIVRNAVSTISQNVDMDLDLSDIKIENNCEELQINIPKQDDANATHQMDLKPEVNINFDIFCEQDVMNALLA